MTQLDYHLQLNGLKDWYLRLISCLCTTSKKHWNYFKINCHSTLSSVPPHMKFQFILY